MEDLFSEMNERRRAVEENIAKAFDTDIEKARSGVYADTAQNRKLNRVGQQYGGKKKQEEPAQHSEKNAEEEGGEGRGSKKTEEGDDNSKEAQAELSSFLDEMEEWDDDVSMRNADRAVIKITNIVNNGNISEEEFEKIAKKHRGLDLVYDDYAYNDKEKKLYKLLNEPNDEEWDDDMFMDQDKQEEFNKRISELVDEEGITEKEFKKVNHIMHSEGLDYSYSDYAGKSDKTSKKKEEDKKQSQGGGAQSTQPIMDAIKTFNGAYKDESKVAMTRTPKGNWDVYYDGHRLGIINGEVVSESVAKEMDWISDDPREHSKRSAEKKYEFKDTEEE